MKKKRAGVIIVVKFNDLCEILFIYYLIFMILGMKLIEID